MDFIPLTVPDGTWVSVIQVVGVGLMVISAVPLVFKKVSETKWATVCAVGLSLGVVAALASLIGAGVLKDATLANAAEWERSVIAEVQDVYGVELSHDEFVALDFPATEPKEDFVAYGTIADTVVKGGQVKQKATTLIWSDGELSLASLKGELTPVGVR